MLLNTTCSRVNLIAKCYIAKLTLGCVTEALKGLSAVSQLIELLSGVAESCWKEFVTTETTFANCQLMLTNWAQENETETIPSAC